jgi:hypothetical protein
MKHKVSARNLPGIEECTRKRLAHGEVGAVDICECGMLQVHIAALTVRMEPRVFSDFIDTVCRAEAMYAALQQQGEREEASLTFSTPRHKRGVA